MLSWAVFLRSFGAVLARRGGRSTLSPGAGAGRAGRCGYGVRIHRTATATIRPTSGPNRRMVAFFIPNRRPISVLPGRLRHISVLRQYQTPEFRLDYVEPRTPSKKIPIGPHWLHELKHDGYRLVARRIGDRVRLFTRGGYDCAPSSESCAVIGCAIAVRIWRWRKARDAPSV